MKILVIFLLMPINCLAQHTKEWLSTFSSGVVINNQLNNKIQLGFSTTFGMEYLYSPQIALWTSFNFDAIGSKTTSKQFFINGSTTFLHGIVGVNYLPFQSKFQPYLLAGLGGTIVSVPEAKLIDNASIELSSNQSLKPSVLLGIGLQKKLKPKLWVFVEANGTVILGKPDLIEQRILLVPIRFGLKMGMF
jgi:opacity protein-like surface antigen